MEAQTSWGSPHRPLCLASWWPVLPAGQGTWNSTRGLPRPLPPKRTPDPAVTHLAHILRGERAAPDAFVLLRQTHGTSGFTHATSEGNLIIMVGYGHHFPSLLCI